MDRKEHSAKKPGASSSIVGQAFAKYVDTEVSGLYEAELTVGKQVGDPKGWKTADDAHAAVTHLTIGENAPAAAVFKKGDAFVAHEVEWRWKDVSSGEKQSIKPANFEGIEDHYIDLKKTAAAKKFVELVDGDTLLTP